MYRHRYSYWCGYKLLSVRVCSYLKCWRNHWIFPNALGVLTEMDNNKNLGVLREFSEGLGEQGSKNSPFKRLGGCRGYTKLVSIPFLQQQNGRFSHICAWEFTHQKRLMTSPRQSPHLMLVPLIIKSNPESWEVHFQGFSHAR